METILQYLESTYHPLAIMTYGSFQNGTNDDFSDYDCMIIVEEKAKNHDHSVVAGVQLDCYIFTRQQALEEDSDTFLTAYDGKIVFDTDGIAAELKARVQEYVAAHSITDTEEKQFIISWIQKTMHRAEKQDDEGSYRAIAFLWESLTDYCILRDLFYFGSKKTTYYLMEHDLAAYELYHKAITTRTNAAIKAWADYVVNIPEACIK